MDSAALFSPFAVKSLKVRNRVAMAPMARWAAPDGDPAPLAGFYRRRIEGGVGLILTEGAIIKPNAGNDPNALKLFGEALDSWPGVIAAVHGAGGAIVPQLWHCGATAKGGGEWTPPGGHESPSGLQSATVGRGKIMSDNDISAVIDAYASAAVTARDLGFDAVEIHAGHGYLLDQFMWDQTNTRADRWGGATLAERSRFPLEVVKAVRAAVGPDLALLLRISQWKSIDLGARIVDSPAELEAWMTPFVDAGIDVINVSQLRYDAPAFDGSGLSLAGWTRKVTGAPTIVAGAIGMTGDFIDTFKGETGHPAPIDGVVERLESGEYDMIAVGRALLADPDWPDRIRTGAARSSCTQARLFQGLD